MFVVGDVIGDSFDWIDESDDVWFDNDDDDCVDVDVDDISIFFNLFFVYDE